jgi:hypothetical protein
MVTSSRLGGILNFHTGVSGLALSQTPKSSTLLSFGIEVLTSCKVYRHLPDTIFLRVLHFDEHTVAIAAQVLVLNAFVNRIVRCRRSAKFAFLITHTGRSSR